MKRTRLYSTILCFLLILVTIFTLNQTKTALADNSGQNGLPKYYSMLDDYYLLNKNQERMGLCWDFAATRSLETLYAKTLNEYVSFSEAGFTFGISEIGGGALGRKHWYALEDEDPEDDRPNGLPMFENQFPYEWLFYANGNPYQISNGNAKRVYEYMKSLKMKGLSKYIDMAEYNAFPNKVKAIKEHILNSSSVFYEINKYNYVDNALNSKVTTMLQHQQNSKLELHAISLIGYDDEYQYEYKGQTYKGAFIAMNSNFYHKNKDSILYVPYKYVENDGYSLDILGYKWNSNKLNELITSTRGAVDRLDNKVKYKDSTEKNYVPEAGKFKTNNIFSKNQKIDIRYTFPENATKQTIRIFDRSKDVTDKFNITQSGQEVRVAQKDLNSLPSKSYNVYLEYIKNGEKQIQYRQLHIIDFAEFLTANSFNGDFNMTAFQHVDSEKQITVLNNTADKGKLTLKPTLYSEIKSYNFDGKGEKPFTLVNGKVDIEIPFDLKEEKIVYKKIVFTLNDNSKVERTLRLIWRRADSKMTFAAIWGLYDDVLDRGMKTNIDPIIPISPDSTSEYSKLNLDVFDKGTHELEQIKLRNKVDAEDFSVSTGTTKQIADLAELTKFKYFKNNYATKSMSDEEKKQYQHSFFIEPKWKNVNFSDLELEITGKTEYVAEDQVKLDDYQLTVKNNPSAVVTLEGVVENQVNYGMKKINFILKYLGKEYTVSKDIIVSKKQLSFDGSQIETALKYTGEIQNFAKGNDKYEFINAQQKNIGSYEVEVTHKNPNYKFPNGEVFKVTCHILEPEVEGIHVTHNSDLHTEDTLDISKIETKINGENKIFTDGITVEYKNSEGYLKASQPSVEVSFYFHEYKITHVLNVSVAKKEIANPEYTKEFTYRGEKQSPTETSEYWTIESPESKDAGTYTCTFRLKDAANYEFKNKKDSIEGEYTIKPAKIPYEIKDNKVNFPSGSKVEYFDDKTTEWKEYKGTETLVGEIRFRVANQNNYEETVIKLKAQKSNENDTTKTEEKKGNKPGKKPENGKALNKGGVAGISVSIILIAGIAVAIAVILILKKKKDKEEGSN